jgi:DNA-binding response OmpR family regulator
MMLTMKNLKNKTLLYAEDEISVQEQYSLYFKNIFKEVYLVTNGEDALCLFEEKKPDVLILDINMPKINGIELTKKIKSINSKIPIILLTARSDKETLKTAIELNLLTYLEKPVSRNDLKEALNKLTKYFEDKNIINLWQVEDNFYYWNNNQKFLYINDKNIKLTKKETLFLNLLIEKNSICTYQDIYEYIWENSDKQYNESTIKTLLSSLRLKLPINAIKSIYGIGYYIELKR